MLMKKFTLCCDGKDHAQDEKERKRLQPRRCCLEEPRDRCINLTDPIREQQEMLVVRHAILSEAQCGSFDPIFIMRKKP
jgi:hypothetical protein